jgi:hypothetical protein
MLNFSSSNSGDGFEERQDFVTTAVNLALKLPFLNRIASKLDKFIEEIRDKQLEIPQLEEDTNVLLLNQWAEVQPLYQEVKEDVEDIFEAPRPVLK